MFLADASTALSRAAETPSWRTDRVAPRRRRSGASGYERRRRSHVRQCLIRTFNSPSSPCAEGRRAEGGCFIPGQSPDSEAVQLLTAPGFRCSK